MAERTGREAAASQAQFDDYVRQTTGAGGPASEIEKAKRLLDNGIITRSEFDAIKAKAIGSAHLHSWAGLAAGRGRTKGFDSGVARDADFSLVLVSPSIVWRVGLPGVSGPLPRARLSDSLVLRGPWATILSIALMEVRWRR